MEGEFKKAWDGDPIQAAFHYVCSELGWNPESVALNKQSIRNAFETLYPGKTIHFVDTPQIYIDTETGTVVDQDWHGSTKKFMETKSRRIKTVADFDQDIKAKHLYIYRVDQVVPGTWNLRLVEYNQGKKTVSFTIDESVIEQFNTVADRLAINKSKFVENKIKEFIDAVK